MSADNFDTEIRGIFLEEASEILEGIEQALLSLESEPHDMEAVNSLFRYAHNLKGSSRGVGFNAMADLTHHLENLLLEVKKGKHQVTGRLVSVLLACSDHLKKSVDLLKTDQSRELASDDLIAMIDGFINAPEGSAEDGASFDSSASELASVAPPIAVSIGSEASTENHATVARSSQPEFEASAGAKKQQATDESIRVALARVDKLINYVGEMVIIQSILRETTTYTTDSAVHKLFHQLSKVTTEVRDISMGLRLVPVKPLMQKLKRIVRDVSLQLNKKIELTVEGEQTEIDKTVLDQISDPLVHLIRNSVDHGIEPADVRAASGKPASGSVWIKAYQASGKLFLEVGDDGKGIDPERIRAKAVRQGLVRESSSLTREECINLIFAPGFSTQEVVSDISGRGVGMDVVQSNIRQLGGKVSIVTEVGQGSRFIVELPTSIAMFDGLVVKVGSERFVIPLSSVIETVRFDGETSRTISVVGDVLLLRGETIAQFTLSEALQVRSAVGSGHQDHIIIVVNHRGGKAAVVVDDIVGQYQLVSKPLGTELAHLQGVQGSAILADGKPALIIDPESALTSRTGRKEAA